MKKHYQVVLLWMLCLLISTYAQQANAQAPNFIYGNFEGQNISLYVGLSASFPQGVNGGAIPAVAYGTNSSFISSGVGTVDNSSTVAQSGMVGMAIDASGNLYVADQSDFVIKKITSAGNVSTFAGTLGTRGTSSTVTSFNMPAGVAVDASGNVYVANFGTNQIKKITSAGVVTNFAGSGTAGSANGTGAAASFNGPMGLTVDGSGNVYVADQGNNLIRKITPAGVVTTYATGFSAPAGIAFDVSGNLFVADYADNRIKEVLAGTQTAITFAGGNAGSADGVAKVATFIHPAAISVDAAGNIFVMENNTATSYRVREISTYTTYSYFTNIANYVLNLYSSAS